MKPHAPTIAKGVRVEVTAGQHRGVTGHVFATFPRVRDPRVMIDAGRGRIVSVPMDHARKIGDQK